MSAENPNIKAHKALSDVFDDVAGAWASLSRGGGNWNGDTARTIFGALLDIMHHLDGDLSAETYTAPNAAPAPIVLPAGGTMQDLAAELLRQMQAGTVKVPAPESPEEQKALALYRSQTNNIAPVAEEVSPLVSPVNAPDFATYAPRTEGVPRTNS